MIFRVLFAIIYFSQFFGIVWFNRKSEVENVVRDRKEPMPVFIVRSVWVVAVVAAIAVYSVDPAALDFASVNLCHEVRVAGVLGGVVTDALLFWTLFSLKKNISMTLSLGCDHRLVTTGPYRYVRHPMYALGVPLFVSLMLVSANWLIGAAGVGFQVFVMIIRVPDEEKMLEERFGDEYRLYRAATGKFIPKM